MNSIVQLRFYLRHRLSMSDLLIRHHLSMSVDPSFLMTFYGVVKKKWRKNMKKKCEKMWRKNALKSEDDLALGLACTVPESGETAVIFIKINGFWFIKKRFNGFKQVPLSSVIC